MAYTPEPTHPMDEVSLPPQLNREFWALFNNDQQLKDYINGALPVKAFNIILDGAGAGDPNATLPNIRLRSDGSFSSYNIDTDFGTNGIIRDGVGLYRFQLKFAQISGEDILPGVYPAFTFHVDFPTNAITRAGPARTSFDDAFQVNIVDVALGQFQIETQHIYSTGGGGLSVEATDMQVNDVLFAAGTFSLPGNAGSYPDTP